MPSKEKIETITSNKIRKLLAYQKQGYVFHGSPNPDIDVLKPKPSTDVNKSNNFNNDIAIYAAVSPTASIIFACMNKSKIPDKLRDGTWSVDLENGEIIAKIPKRWKPYIVFNIGYIYVLDSKSFFGDAKGSWQVKSKESLIPTSVVRVAFGDFEEMGGKIIWLKKDLYPLL